MAESLRQLDSVMIATEEIAPLRRQLAAWRNSGEDHCTRPRLWERSIEGICH